MCGIVGYIGKNQALPFLLDGLKRLEYRGYDSSGICLKNNSGFYLAKKPGRISELESQIDQILAKGNIGIAHTRWATHGAPNEINSHPHVDCKGSIAIVHNGIIENYNSLKELLKGEGHIFVSDTDSEVVAHLVEKFYEGDLEVAVKKSLKLIEGAYALAVLDKTSEKIVVTRKSSPLVLGIGVGEIFVASDVPAMLSKTKRVIYLDDNEVAVLTKDGYAVKNINGFVVDKEIYEVAMDVEQIEKKGFKYFMLKEIFEQPEAIENTLRGRIKDGKIRLSVNFNPREINRIIITACGTSWYSGLIGKYLIEKLSGISVEVDYASEFRYRNPIVRQDDLIIVISQSGETADTLAALEEAKKKGAKTLGIINVVGSTIAREVDSGIYLHAGPEIGVASTKAFTCQVTALTLFALYLKQERGDLPSDVILEIENIPQKIKEILKKSEEIRELAKIFKDAKNFLYLGRNLNFPVALEGALKLKEISYIHAEGYPAAEMKHGPIALVDKHMPVVFICPQDAVYSKIISNMQEIKAREGNVIAVINKEDPKIRDLANYVIKVPETIDELSPIINVVPLQLLAYHIADLKGLNVDKPRNLAKSVTVE
ncbi:MAG: glutamine--fructose-6-phosphate transaminase (isomerizing) [Candidatus Staskawiczbacteria bacterium]|nr:glutamine--fructose-6-phosphate transaminase (isomerizing) [Candidatus Staskawiczbacteria bacterium]